ncbi:MAG TPA: hypothetical protein DEB35_07245 [Desulfuromonas sp.]|nr:hypothetical protein [Desulfuromonas sp.]
MIASWRLLQTGPATAAWNMALDEALLETVAHGTSPPVLRLYRWRPAAVSLGYFQRGDEVVNLAACRRLGLDVVRRCTGGRAVLHDCEVTYAVIAREEPPHFPGTITGNYTAIAAVLQRFLRSYGLEVDAGGASRQPVRRSGAEQSACFTAPAQFEQVYRGCKLTGSAQKRQQGAFLQHGSIPLELDPEQLFAALDTRGKVNAVHGGKRLARQVGWLNRWLPEAVTLAEVEGRLAACFAATLAVSLEPDEPHAGEMRRCAELVREKYGNPAWNLAGIAHCQRI